MRELVTIRSWHFTLGTTCLLRMSPTHQWLLSSLFVLCQVSFIHVIRLQFSHISHLTWLRATSSQQLHKPWQSVLKSNAKVLYSFNLPPTHPNHLTVDMFQGSIVLDEQLQPNNIKWPAPNTDSLTRLYIVLFVWHQPFTQWHFDERATQVATRSFLTVKNIMQTSFFSRELDDSYPSVCKTTCCKD